jgi:hypothetical protein
MSEGQPNLYLNMIVDLTVESMSYREMVSVLLTQQRDLQRKFNNCQTAQRELRLRYRTENPS